MIRKKAQSQLGVGKAQETSQAAPAPIIFVAVLLVGVGLRLAFPVRFLPRVVTMIVGVAFFFLPFVLGFAAFGATRRARTSVNPYRPTTVLITSGPFRVSRNPMYLAMVVQYAGLALLFNALWAIVLLPLALIVVHLTVIKLRNDIWNESSARNIGSARQKSGVGSKARGRLRERRDKRGMSVDQSSYFPGREEKDVGKMWVFFLVRETLHQENATLYDSSKQLSQRGNSGSVPSERNPYPLLVLAKRALALKRPKETPVMLKHLLVRSLFRLFLLCLVIVPWLLLFPSAPAQASGGGDALAPDPCSLRAYYAPPTFFFASTEANSIVLSWIPCDTSHEEGAAYYQV